MGQATGSNSKFIVDVESTYGTSPASPASILVYGESEGFTQDIELISSNILRGNRNPTAPVSGNRSVKGSLKTQLAPFGQALFFKHLLGGVTTTGTTNYTHVFKVGALPTSLCFEKYFAELSKYFLYNGVRISKASFDFKSSGSVDLNFDFAGQKETVGDTSLDATPTDLGHSPFDMFQAAILEGGSSIGIVTAAKVDIDNDLQTDLYVIGGGGYVKALPEGRTKVTGTITALFESVDLYNKAVNGTESSLKITLTKGTGLGSAGNEFFELLVPELLYKAATPTIKDSKGIMIELPFEGYYGNSSEASAVQITLKNTQATI